MLRPGLLSKQGNTVQPNVMQQDPVCDPGASVLDTWLDPVEPLQIRKNYFAVRPSVQKQTVQMMQKRKPCGLLLPFARLPINVQVAYSTKLCQGGFVNSIVQSFFFFLFSGTG